VTGPVTGLVAFDLDGTLVDSAADLAAAASALTESLGGRALTPAEVVAMVGEGAPVLVRRALAAAGLDPDTPGALARFLALYDERLLATTRLYPGIRQVLDALDPLLPLAVVTNKPAAPTARILDALGVHPHFIEVVGGDGPFPRKPDPAGLRSLAGYAGGGPIVLVGDSDVDAETARRAGAAFVLAAYGFGADRVAADATPFVAATAADLPRVIGEALRLGRLRA
jgi:phosphoglycolate phosphatase